MTTIEPSLLRETTESLRFKRIFLWRATFVLAGAMFLDGYIFGIFGPVASTIGEDLALSSLMEGLIGAAVLVGILISAPVGGWAADKFGRKPVLVTTLILFLAFSALQLLPSEPWQQLAIRLGIGVTVGIQYAMGLPMLSEFSPSKLRGRLLGATLVAWYMGFAVAFSVGQLLDSVGLSWRIILATSGVIALILLVAQLGVPETPHWLRNNGQSEEAMRIARRYLIEGSDDVQEETSSHGTFGMLFSTYWKTTLFTCAFWFCAVTPYFAIATFADSVLAEYGLGDGLAGGVGLSLLSVSGVVVMILLIDRVGRRTLIIPTQWTCAALLAIIGVWSGAPAAVILILFFAFSFFTVIYGAMTNIYPSEVFPTEIRAAGTGFAVSVSRIGAAIGTFLLPWAITNLGATVTMLIAAAIAAAGALVSQILAPETKGKSLTEASSGSP